MLDTLKNLWAEVREWLGTWGGKLAAIAAPLATVLSDQAATALGLAQFVPEGPARLVLLIAIGAAAFLLPMKAQKADVKAAVQEAKSEEAN